MFYNLSHLYHVNSFLWIYLSNFVSVKPIPYSVRCIPRSYWFIAMVAPSDKNSWEELTPLLWGNHLFEFSYLYIYAVSMAWIKEYDYEDVYSGCHTRCSNLCQIKKHLERAFRQEDFVELGSSFNRYKNNCNSQLRRVWHILGGYCHIYLIAVLYRIQEYFTYYKGGQHCGGRRLDRGWKNPWPSAGWWFQEEGSTDLHNTRQSTFPNNIWKHIYLLVPQNIPLVWRWPSLLWEETGQTAGGNDGQPQVAGKSFRFQSERESTWGGIA